MGSSISRTVVSYAGSFSYGVAFMHSCLMGGTTTQSGHGASIPSLIYLDTALTLALLMIKNRNISSYFLWKLVVKNLFHFSLLSRAISL